MTAQATVDARLLPCAVAAWAATLVGLYSGWRISALVTAAAVLGALVVVLSAKSRVDPCRRKRRGHSHTRDGVMRGVLAVLVVTAGFGGAVAMRMWFVEHHPLATAPAGAWVTAVVEPTDDPRIVRSSPFGGEPQVRIPVAVRHVTLRGESMTVGGRAVVFAPAHGWRHLLPGQRVTMRGRVSENAASGGPDPGTSVAVLRADGPPRATETPSALAEWAGSVREDLAEVSARALGPSAAGLFPGLIVGDTSRLPDDVREDFRVSGLTHLTAVSGANVSILLGAVLLLVRFVGIGPRTGAFLAGVALVLFVVVVRPSPSVVRAAAMGAVALLALVVGRQRQALPALCAAIGILVLVWPELAVDVGFALSATATAGLVLVAPVWVALLQERGWPRAVAEVCAVSCAAYIVTAPILAAATGTVSVVAVVANVLVTPVLAPLTVLGSVVALCASVVPGVAEFLARGAAPMLWWLMTVADRAASLPSAELSLPDGIPGGAVIGGAALVGCVLLRYRRIRVVAGIALVSTLIVWIPVRLFAPGWPSNGWVFAACDVGQGDAVVLAVGDGRAVVVDAGPEATPVDRCLRRLRIDSVPVVIVSHLHADHMGGLRGVLQGRRVGEVVVGPGAVSRDTAGDLAGTAGEFGVRIRETMTGEVLRVGTVTIRILGPPAERSAESENDLSLVMVAETTVGRILLPGDAEAPALDALMRAGEDLRADVLKVPHHGSRTTPEAFVAAVRPRVAVISAGRDNTFGHPHPEIVEALNSVGSRILRTDLHGDVAVVRAGSGALAVVSDSRGTIGP
ncbi:competence protein ComEC [Rhodococcus sp. SMB37]|uniref:DNA internalization-related competence protein ComEC/Rec2 n=1 Tax=Rhodococcus sp. SMB37 TaxID=2512213 RepID=UPI00104BB146|nr:DNA internalization-related competence protein ComEC/Rec2 [Rhodococcus sp. SMB37]TCN56928.1 competence protein ComEC [Rhodococcus sp. SMB37]